MPKPDGCSVLAGLVADVLLTCMLLIIAFGATDACPPESIAPIAIGLGLTLIHLIGIVIRGLTGTVPLRYARPFPH